MPVICPCGSGRALHECCAPVIEGRSAASAEQLMRSRYSAYVLGKPEYLLATWHISTRPASLPGDQTEWLGLHIVNCERGGVADEQGEVEFVAAFREAGKVLGLHETSRFVKEGGHWFYVDGRCELKRFGRNEPCPCGSGRKVKQCCAALGSQ